MESIPPAGGVDPTETELEDLERQIFIHDPKTDDEWAGVALRLGTNRSAVDVRSEYGDREGITAGQEEI